MARYMTRAFAIPTGVTAAHPYTVGSTYANGYLRSVADATNPYQPVPLATDIRYDRHGRVSRVTHGNGIIEEVGAGAYGMARPSYHRTQGALGARGAAGDWDSGTYLYDGAGNVKAIGASRFVYDALSRLTEGRVVANGSTHTQTVQFDPFGNLTSNFTTTFGTRNLPTTTWNNHLTSGTYDHAGSLTSWNLWSYEWDPVAMMRRRTTAGRDWRFFYTAGDERFWSVDLGTWATSDFTLRDLDGKVLRVYEAAGGKWSRITDYVWRGEALLARDFAYTRPEAFHLDHLGTPRLLTNHRAERLAQPNYYPFGEEITVETQVAERMKLTGHERDMLGTPGVADDMDYMHARYANPITGRFLTTDPVLTARAPGRPQAWNLYGYTIGNPLKYIDPYGELWFKVDGRWSFFKDTSVIEEIVVKANGESWSRQVQGRGPFTTFDGSQLVLRTKDGKTRRFRAVSGVVDRLGRTQPHLQGEWNRGPIPEGRYGFNPALIYSYDRHVAALDKLAGLLGRGGWRGGRATWGDYRVELIPDPATNLLGRDARGFFIHGGSTPGSAGCIDLCEQIGDFVHAVGTTAGTIDVDVDYP